MPTDDTDDDATAATLLDVSLTDEPPLAQAIVVITALPEG